MELSVLPRTPVLGLQASTPTFSFYMTAGDLNQLFKLTQQTLYPLSYFPNRADGILSK